MSSAAASAGTEGDLGAIDEVKSFHHEGDGEENLTSLNDLKQDLEQEADTDKAKQPSTPKVTTGAPVFSQNGTTSVPLPLFPKMAYSTAQPVQFMFPGIPSLVPNGTFPSTATIATSMPGAIKMEFPQNGTAVSGAPGMVLPGYHPAANLAMHAYPYMLAGQYMMPQLLPVAGSNGCSPNVIMSQQGIIQQPAKEKKPHIKKPLNAFMLFMKEKRQEVIKECTLKESAAINQILGKMWHQLDKSEQAKYYEMARQERARHMQMYPGWSARDNYALHKKRKRRKAPKEEEETTKTYPTSASPVITTIATSVSSEEILDPNGKKCRARFGTEQRHMWCDPCKRKKRCIKFSDGDDECEGSSLSSSPTRNISSEMTSVGVTMETNDDNNSVFNEAWEPIKTTSSSHEISSVVLDPTCDKKSPLLPVATITSDNSSGE